MPASVAEFVKAAEESGILTADSLAEFLRGVAPETDATVLANRLVTAGRITAFQAKHIYGGKAGSLILGPYVVVDLLGKGGMGYVYKAEHRRMRRVVALKVIAKAALKSPAAVLRFEREVQAAARLEHPNIVTAFDAGEAAGTHYLVMQFVDGRNLSEVVKELGPQPVGRVVDWVQQAARGLAYAHGKGVVHRDIKPGNLLVDQDGAVKILDMGLARLETLDADQDQLTGTGQIMGTVDYMAPEQAMDTRQADARSDIYSLGVTLWYLLTGRPLFTGDTVMNKMMAHMHTAAPSLLTVRGEISPDLEALFQKMVAKKPADRFQAMQDVITALQSLPQSDSAAGPPSIALGRGGASLGPLGTGGTQTLQRQKSRQAQEADENTTRLSAVDVDTDAGVKNIRKTVRRPAVRKKQASVAIVGGALGASLLIGLVMFAFGGRRDGGSSPRAGGSDAGSKARNGSSLDSLASVAVPEPAVPTPAERGTALDSAPPSGGKQSATPPLAEAPFDAKQAREHQEAWAKHLGIVVETTNSIGQTLVLIPPGKFKMGDYGKTVDVTLTTPFLFGETEVTQGQWKEVMGTEPWKGREYTSEGTDVAATFISWADAVTFCEKLTELERGIGRISQDHEYRLPAEAEWEFACRAGTITEWSFGSSADLLTDYAWFGGDWDQLTQALVAGGNTVGETHAHAVKRKLPNPWGLFDVHGNVFEWVTDPFPGPADSTRVIKGGSWMYGEHECGSGYRNGYGLKSTFPHLGFRIVLASVGLGQSHAVDQFAVNSPRTPLRSPPLAIAPFDATQARKHQEAWAKHLGIEVEKTNSIGQTLVVIPPGRFTMGEGDKTFDVTLTKPFLLGQTEVTQGQWKEVMGTEPWKGQQYTIEGADVAATCVSWDDAVSFCAKLTERERGSGKISREQAYRLPTEAEWEFACRAGTNTLFSFGEDNTRIADYAWHGGGWDNTLSRPLPGGNTILEMYAHPVRLKTCNSFGLFDIHGNAREYVAKRSQTLEGNVGTKMEVPADTLTAILRGGDWLYNSWACRSASRIVDNNSLPTRGFRIALGPPRAQHSPTRSTTGSTVPARAIAPFDATQAKKHQEAWADHVGIEVETTNSIGQTLVLIPPGKFTMGEGDTIVEVTLTQAVLLSQTEVTNAQWQRVMGDVPSTWKDADRPVEQVSWEDAVEFCRRLSALPREQQAGREYRLPTEAEWEYACRAGTQTGYSYGDDGSTLGDFAWYAANSGEKPVDGDALYLSVKNPTTGAVDWNAFHHHFREHHCQTHPVGLKRANAWGLYDMHGNVWEWCSDWLGAYPKDAVTDPQGPSGGSYRVLRGGCWNDSATKCRSAFRFRDVPAYRFSNLGLRLALSPSGESPPEAAPTK